MLVYCFTKLSLRLLGFSEVNGPIKYLPGRGSCALFGVVLFDCSLPNVRCLYFAKGDDNREMYSGIGYASHQYIKDALTIC